MKRLTLAISILIFIVSFNSKVWAEIKSSKITCMASLAKNGSSSEELKVALALQEIFYYRFCQVPGATTLMTLAKSTDTVYGKSFIAKNDEDWAVPFFSSADDASIFAKKYKIDILFYGELSLNSGKYSVKVKSTNINAAEIKFESSGADLCDQWLIAICKLASHLDIKLTIEQELKIKAPSSKNISELIGLGALIEDAEIDDELEMGPKFLKVVGSGEEDPNVGQKILAYYSKCILPESFYKFAFYNSHNDTEFGWIEYLTAIGLSQNNSKAFMNLPISYYPTLPKYILIDQGYKTDSFLVNLKKFKLNQTYIDKVHSNAKKEVVEVLIWYAEQALISDDDDFIAMCTLLGLYSLKDNKEKFAFYAIKLKSAYPIYAAELFKKVNSGNLEEKKEHWNKIFLESK